ncbi:late competence development ComFB family protein [bacterium]|nr:late competence development ComFB family protein [bacterium]
MKGEVEEDMDIINLMEEQVRITLEEHLEQKTGICTCPQCISDMMVYALNRLPARYVSKQRGETFSRIGMTDDQGRTSVIAAVVSAIKVVSQAPNH